jgi:hypothetical protein
MTHSQKDAHGGFMANVAMTRQGQHDKIHGALFEAANHDPVLKRRLLANPKNFLSGLSLEGRKTGK